MKTYREEANEAAREAGWTFRRFLPLALGAIAVVSVVGFGLNTLGLIGGTIVERKVFEQSYQRSQSINARIAADEANLAEISAQLRRSDLDQQTRANLEAQAAAARVRITTAQGEN